MGQFNNRGVKGVARKGYLILALLLMMSLTLVGCSSEGGSTEGEEGGPTEAGEAEGVKEEDKYGGKVTIRTHQNPSALGYTPKITPPSSTVPVVQPALETLGRYNPDGSMGPWLATDWEMDPEAKTITMQLREGVTFHDGTEFNAEAVKWVFDSVLEAEGRGLNRTVKSVEVIDSHTVRFHLINWSTGILEDLLWQYPITSPKAYEEMGEEGVLFHPVGTGPFMFDSYEPDVHIRYKRYDNYWQEGLPYLDELEFRIIVDPNTALNAFLGNELDINLNVPGDIIADYADTDQFDIVPVETIVGLNIVGLVGNSLDPDSPFADARVRKAITYAINREEIAQSLFKGYVLPTNQYALPGSPYYDPDLEPFEYNPEKAKQLLAEAGYPDGFSTTLIGVQQESVLLQAVQGYLAEVGIDAKVDIVDRARYLAMCMDEGWDGLIVYVATSGNEFRSLMAPHFGPTASIWGPFTIRPDDVIELMDQFDQETDPDARVEIARELQRAVFEEHHMVNLLYVTKTPYMKHKHVQDDGIYTQRTILGTPEKMWIKK